MFNESKTSDLMMELFNEVVELLKSHGNTQDKYKYLLHILYKLNILIDPTKKEDLKVAKNILIASAIMLNKVKIVNKRNKVYKDNCDNTYEKLILILKESTNK